MPQTDGPAITSAFGLGWHMTELYVYSIPPTAPQGQKPILPKALPGMSEIGDLNRARIRLGQIKFDLTHMSKNQGLSRLADAIGEQIESTVRTSDAPFKSAVFEAHMQLMRDLARSDFTLSKGYRLGLAIAETALRPGGVDPAIYLEVMNPHRIENIRGWLRDMKTCLPPHAGPAVEDSLDAWRQWSARSGIREHTSKKAQPIVDGKVPVPQWPKGVDGNRVCQALRRQGEIWRSLLSGEKNAVDMLTVSDYVAATGSMVSNIATVAWSFVRSRIGLLLLLTVALASLIPVLVLFTGNGAVVIAGVIGALGSLGLTASSIGAAVWKAMAPAQTAMWNAELQQAISKASTKLPPEVSAEPGPGHPARPFALPGMWSAAKPSAPADKGLA